METQGGSQDHQQGQPRLASPAQADIGPSSPSDKEGQKKSPAAFILQRRQGFSFVFEFIVALAALVGIAFVWRQTHYMEESNRLTRESNAMTRKANEDALTQMKESNRLTREALEESRRQSEASLTQSAQQGSAELDLTRQSLRESREALALSQRARLVVDRFEMGGEPTKPTGIVHIKNAGAATATEVRWEAAIKSGTISSADLPPPMKIPAFLRQGPVTAIGGGGSYPIEVNSRDVGAGMFFLYGHVQYMDGFGKLRMTEFCAYYPHYVKPQPQRWEPCYQKNTVDWSPGEERLHWPPPHHQQ